MNSTPQTRPNLPSQSRIAAAALATVLTLAMLLGVNHLATSEMPAAQMARLTHSGQAPA